jgi:hypothetical protein
MSMAKTSLASMSIDALLKLREDIGKALSRRANELEMQLSRLGGEIGKKRGRRSSLKAGRLRSNIAIDLATRGQDEERSPSGCERN